MDSTGTPASLTTMTSKSRKVCSHRLARHFSRKAGRLYVGTMTETRGASEYKSVLGGGCAVEVDRGRCGMVDACGIGTLPAHVAWPACSDLATVGATPTARIPKMGRCHPAIPWPYTVQPAARAALVGIHPTSPMALARLKLRKLTAVSSIGRSLQFVSRRDERQRACRSRDRSAEQIGKAPRTQQVPRQQTDKAAGEPTCR